MIKVYIGQLLEEVPYLEILYPNLGNWKPEKLTDRAFRFLDNPIVQIVDNPALAEYFLLPHNWNYVRENSGYLDCWEKLIKDNSKRIIVFHPGDSFSKVSLVNSIVFRHSAYRSDLLSNEIIMPAYAEDLSGGQPIVLREKSEKPVVGFCGWARLPNKISLVKYWLKNFWVFPKSHRQGLWWRRRLIKILSKSTKIKTNFILRSSYSGHLKTIELDYNQARRDYIDNMIGSDFILAPRGDGNFSVRFYEALSMGRIPILIDTDVVLPLEDKLNYEEFILRVDCHKVSDLPDLIIDYWRKNDLKERQIKAREAFVGSLRMDKFLSLTLKDDFLNRLK